MTSGLSEFMSDIDMSNQNLEDITGYPITFLIFIKKNIISILSFYNLLGQAMPFLSFVLMRCSLLSFVTCLLWIIFIFRLWYRPSLTKQAKIARIVMQSFIMIEKGLNTLQKNTRANPFLVLFAKKKKRLEHNTKVFIFLVLNSWYFSQNCSTLKAQETNFGNYLSLIFPLFHSLLKLFSFFFNNFNVQFSNMKYFCNCILFGWFNLLFSTKEIIFNSEKPI